MFDLRLTAEPLHHDEHGQPCFPVSQDKGLAEEQGDDLLAGALAHGYTAAVAETLIAWIVRRVASFGAGRPLDVLEIGGGSGGLFERMKGLMRTYVNVEPGRVVLTEAARARLRDPRYKCVKCSAEEVPLPDESVDVVIALASLDHVPDHRRALGEARRLLRPGGILILTLNNRRSWWKVLLARTAYLRRREERISREHHFQWSFAECRANVGAFLRVSEMSTTTYFPYVPRVWRYLLPAADGLGRVFLPRLGANVLAVFEKPAGDRG